MNPANFKNTIVVGVAVAALSGVAFVACEDSDSSGVSEREVLTHLADKVILPAHESFVEATQTLAMVSTDYCGGDSTTSPLAIQDAWLAAQKAVQHVELYNFGPWTEFPSLLGSRINTWPAASENILEFLNGDAPRTLEELQKKGARERGLPVVEFLLFGDPGVNSVDEGFEQTPRCDYLVAATNDLQEQAQALLDAWSPEGGDFITKLANPDGSDMMFATNHDSLSELVNRLWFAVENVRRDSITKPLGASQTNANPLAAEGARGDAVYDSMIATLDAVETLFLGAPACEEVSGNSEIDISSGDSSCDPLPHDGANTETPSIDALLADRGRQDVVAAFEQEIRGARASIRGLPEDWSNAVFDGRSAVATMSDELKDVQLILQADVFNVLGLSIAFNDNDGD